MKKEDRPNTGADILSEREWRALKKYLQGAMSGSVATAESGARRFSAPSIVPSLRREPERGRIRRHRVSPDGFARRAGPRVRGPRLRCEACRAPARRRAVTAVTCCWKAPAPEFRPLAKAHAGGIGTSCTFIPSATEV